MTSVNNKEYNLCPYCYTNNYEDSTPSDKYTPCFLCPNPTFQMSSANNNQNTNIFKCHTCSDNYIQLKKSKNN